MLNPTIAESPSEGVHPKKVGSLGLALRVKWKKTATLTIRERNEMARLYMAYYNGIKRGLFFNDLASKEEVLWLEDGDQLAGFTSYVIYERHWRGRRIRIVFSGDTIVVPAQWGQQALAFRWIERMGRLKANQPTVPLYWFLICKGHRTYRYLSAFAQHYYPHPSNPLPDLKMLANFLAEDRFGPDYNRATGVVAFSPSRGHLCAAIADPRSREKARPDVDHFLLSNPGFREGHELVCLCELSSANLKPLGRRLFEKGQKETAIE